MSTGITDKPVAHEFGPPPRGLPEPANTQIENSRGGRRSLKFARCGCGTQYGGGAVEAPLSKPLHRPRRVSYQGGTAPNQEREERVVPPRQKQNLIHGWATEVEACFDKLISDRDATKPKPTWRVCH